GCQLQHLVYERQLEAKRGIIHDSLTRIGRLQVEMTMVQPSETPWRYRRKLTLALRRHGSRWIAGLFRYDIPEVFELRDCLITREEVLEAWRLVLAHQQFLPDVKELRAAVRLLPGGFSFTVEGALKWEAHERFFAAIPTLSELWWQPQGKSRRLLRTRSSGEQAGASFTQVNSVVAAELRDWVL